MKILKRTYRKYQQAGYSAVLKNGWDVFYRKNILKRHLIPQLLEESSRTVIENPELEIVAKKHGGYWNVELLDKRPQIPEKTTTDHSFNSLPTRKSPEPIVSTFRNSQLWMPSGLGIASDGAFIGDTISFRQSLDGRLRTALSRCVLQNGLRWTIPRVIGKKREIPNRTANIACSLVPLWDNYYHWSCESLLKLMGVDLYEQFTGEKPLLVLPPDPSSWMLESLELLGYGSERRLVPDTNAINVNKLVVPSFPDPSPEECRWLRQRARAQLSIPTGTDGERVYISRSQATRRRVINETEVISVLEDFGFQSYVLENLTVREQIQLFSDAEIVIGPHGAGFTNIIYSTDVKVIELFGDWLKSTFYRLCILLGLEYEYLRCSSHGLDIHVDTSRLHKLVDEIINK